MDICIAPYEAFDLLKDVGNDSTAEREERLQQIYSAILHYIEPDMFRFPVQYEIVRDAKVEYFNEDDCDRVRLLSDKYHDDTPRFAVWVYRAGFTPIVIIFPERDFTEDDDGSLVAALRHAAREVVSTDSLRGIDINKFQFGFWPYGKPLPSSSADIRRLAEALCWRFLETPYDRWPGNGNLELPAGMRSTDIID